MTWWLAGWDSRSSFGRDGYHVAYFAHSYALLTALALGGLGTAQIAMPIPRDRVTLLIGVSSLVLVGAQTLVLDLDTQTSLLLVTIFASVGFTGAVGMRAAVQRRHERGAWGPLSTGLVAVSAAQILVIFAGFVDVRPSPAFFVTLFMTSALALLAEASAPATKAPILRGLLVLYLGLGARAELAEPLGWEMPLAVAQPLVGLALVALIADGLRRARQPRFQRIVAWFALAWLSEGLALRGFLALIGTDTQLHVTSFVSGVEHLELMGLAIALGGHWLGGREPRRAWLAYGALATVAASLHLVIFGQLVLGSRGMPRRYVNYIEEFTDLHRLVAVGGVLAIIGMVALALSVRRTRGPVTPGLATAFD